MRLGRVEIFSLRQRGRRRRNVATVRRKQEILKLAAIVLACAWLHREHTTLRFPKCQIALLHRFTRKQTNYHAKYSNLGGSVLFFLRIYYIVVTSINNLYFYSLWDQQRIHCTHSWIIRKTGVTWHDILFHTYYWSAVYRKFDRHKIWYSRAYTF